MQYLCIGAVDGIILLFQWRWRPRLCHGIASQIGCCACLFLCGASDSVPEPVSASVEAAHSSVPSTSTVDPPVDPAIAAAVSALETQQFRKAARQSAAATAVTAAHTHAAVITASTVASHLQVQALAGSAAAAPQSAAGKTLPRIESVSAVHFMCAVLHCRLKASSLALRIASRPN